jgi:hypothetical protein
MYLETAVDSRKIYLMKRKNELIYALDNFVVKKVRIPKVLLCDNNSTMEG